jgi:hypothetical protein
VVSPYVESQIAPEQPGRDLVYETRTRQATHDLKLVVHPGRKHARITMVYDIRKFANFFDQHLRSTRE